MLCETCLLLYKASIEIVTLGSAGIMHIDYSYIQYVCKEIILKTYYRNEPNSVSSLTLFIFALFAQYGCSVMDVDWVIYHNLVQFCTHFVVRRLGDYTIHIRCGVQDWCLYWCFKFESL